MSLLVALRLRVFCVVAMSASVITPGIASSQTDDCQLEAASISGLRVSSTAPGVSPGSTSGTGDPGASNSTGGDTRARRTRL